MFTMHPSLKAKISVVDLSLCHVLLENNRHYPWLILVPSIPHCSSLLDVPYEHQQKLLNELNQAQAVLKELFAPDQLNVAAIGNKTPQLHFHVIARFKSDPAWPGVVWDHPSKDSYGSSSLEETLQRLKKAFSYDA